MTDTIAFNLIDEPWIRVVDAGGGVREVGIREALLEAGSFRGLAGELPTQDFALLRMLLAVVQRAVFPGAPATPEDGLDAWEDIWQSGSLPTGPIDDYLRQWRHRFNLVDEESPFLQTPGLRTAKGEWKDLSVIIPDSPGAGAMYTRHDPDRPIGLGEAARWVVHCMSYDVSGIKSGAVGDPRVKGGKGYPLGIGWCGWLGGIAVEGDTLFETLMLNTIADREETRSGTPAWEQPVPGPAPRAPGEIGEMGAVTLFTWQQRRILLRVEDGWATGALVCNGDPVDYTAQYGREPMTSWRFSLPQSRKAKTAVYMPRMLDPDRAMWRGLESLLGNPGGERVKYDGEHRAAAYPADVVEWTGRLTFHEILDGSRLLRVRGAGVVYGPQMSSYAQIFEDRLVLAAGVLENAGQLRSRAFAAAERADDGVRALANLADNLVQAAGGDRGPASAEIRARAFADLDTGFRDWLRRLTPECDKAALLDEWTDEVRSTIQRMADDLIRATPDVAWAGREVAEDRVLNVGLADAWFRRALVKALPAPESERDSGDDPTADRDPR